MKKYIPVVLFVFSCQVFSADIHGRVVRVLDGDTIDVMLSQHPVRVVTNGAIVIHTQRLKSDPGGNLLS